MRTNLVRNDKGLSLIEVIFAVFISGVAILTLNIFATQMDMENKKLSDSSAAARKNYDFLELMNNPTMWKATVLDVKNYSYFSCKLGLNPHPDAVGPVDCSKVDNKFRIISSDGNSSIVYDQNEKDGAGQLVGFTPEGGKCYGFDPLNGSDTCPTHYEISWDLPCLKNASCREPMATVTVKQITKYLTKKNLDSEKNFNLNINLPQSSEIAPRDSTYMVGINSSELNLDILKTDYSSDLFNLKLKTVESSVNSNVVIKNNKISYIPKSNFYGIDRIHYTVEQSLFDKVTKSEGVIWIKVMTPYTWVGEGPVEQTSASGKKWYSLYNKMNWCGEVVNFKCTHFNPDPNKAVDNVSFADLRAASLVFNETCVNCNVLMKALPSGVASPEIAVNAIEIGASFPGEIKQLDNLNISVIRNASNRNPNDPAIEFAFLQRGGVFIGANSKANLLLDEVVSEDKFISITRQEWTGNSVIKISNGVVMSDAYGYFSINGGKFYAPERIVTHGGYSIISDRNSFYHQNGRYTVHPRWASGNFLDAPGVTFNEFAYNGAGGFEFNLIGGFNVKDLYMYQSGYENQLRGYRGTADSGTITVARNIYLHGGGGFMINGWGESWGYANILVNSSSDQYIYSNLDVDGNKDRTKMGRLPILTVNKPSGTLHIKGDIGFTTGINIIKGPIQFYNKEEVAAGDQQMVEFSSTWNTMYIKNTSGTELVLPNLELSPQCAHLIFETNVRVAGDLIQDKMKYNPQCSSYLFGPRTSKVLLEGDLYLKSGSHEYYENGLITIEMTGIRNQRIIGTSNSFIKNNVANVVVAAGGVDPSIVTTVEAARGALPHLVINKTGGQVRMTGAIGFVGNFTVVRGDVNAAEAHLSFTNTNGYEGTVNLAGLQGQILRIRGLNVNRGIDLSGHTLEVTNGINFPTNIDYNNNGSVANGTLKLFGGNLYYNDNFDRIKTDANRARIVFEGIADQTIYTGMVSDATRYGSHDIVVDKKLGGVSGKLSLDCGNNASSVFLAQRLTLRDGNIDLNNCGLKTTRRLEITKADGNIDRGATPGVFQYGSLVNNGTITPNVVAGH